MKLLIYIINLIKRGYDIMSETLKNVKVSNLSITFAQLIESNMITFDDVKSRFKSDVAVVLIVDGYEDKITDEKYLNEAKKRLEDAAEKEEPTE